jgi:hypothetical protein
MGPTMVKRKTSRPRRSPAAARRVSSRAHPAPTAMPEPNTGFSPLHALFDQQVREILEAADLDEEQKQSILVAMSCPCCGGGTGSFSIKLKPRV